METKRSLTVDEFDRPILTVDQTIDYLLYGKCVSDVVVEGCHDVDLYDEYRGILDNSHPINPEVNGYISREQFHNIKVGEWTIPSTYLDFPVEEYLLGLCVEQDEIERVNMELSMFKDRGMIPLLRVLIYLVDHMRSHKYVWGIGRGSSVASYCLFLIGIHKVDSIRYNLDIREFLK